MSKKKAIVIGAGIVGLATARALAVRDYQVEVIERTDRAVGASIRNFGMIWPIGQPDGELYERAQLSRSIWKEICDEANIWHEEAGSLHVAHNQMEWDVLQELAAAYKHRKYELLSTEQSLKHSEAIVSKNLKGSLLSHEEMIVEARSAIGAVTNWLNKKWGVTFNWGKVATSVQYPNVFVGNEVWSADEIYVCSGADFETLYPNLFAEAPFTKCKLQMLRMTTQPNNWRIGPSLCGGLSLIHYQAFNAAASLDRLREYYEANYSGYLKWGIHVMVSQNAQGELTIGDSHEYAMTHDPFDKHFINNMILDYLNTFAQFKNESIIQTWNGIYPKLTNGETEWIIEPESGVTVINGLGGAGMTLSFGLAEQLIQKKDRQNTLQFHYNLKDLNMQRRDILKSLALASGTLILNNKVLAESGERAAKKSITIAHITDVHIRQDLNAPERFKKSLSQIISKHKPDVFLNGGDSIYDASYDTVTRERAVQLWDIWDDCISMVKDRYEIYSCIGNHDPWWKAPSKEDPMYGIPYVVKRLKIPARYYHVQKDQWHFVILDGNNKGISIDEEQYLWLENLLANIPAKEHVLLMSHYPVFGATIQFEGGGHSDFKKLDSLFYKHRNKVKVFLSGHNHLLDKTLYNDITYCCNGAMSGFWWEPGNKESAGPSYFKQTAPGYAILKLYDDGSVENKYYAHGY
ncbi:TIGR03364 family FAD-dependent oxidoreductase [Niabella ginsengisoli]|uniref:TIGR03364 family FAD-dependent oxidoreductase n=1 Tax=Niabella ginsengisoli TaxID=522298 RepID=A0ABS9SIY1_9BACT|nr:TIGR03364 family FAD-dependent oxidoreductase [Niabella ginsengisoli]MCH5598266.1 TIGR03364 family FAD-dependent oxidoreductase [Niabella ginsengisoli]